MLRDYIRESGEPRNPHHRRYPKTGTFRRNASYAETMIITALAERLDRQRVYYDGDDDYDDDDDDDDDDDEADDDYNRGNNDLDDAIIIVIITIFPSA